MMHDNVIGPFLMGLHVALVPGNFFWILAGVVLGNLIGVLPGLGPLSAISMLLPITYKLHPLPAILMLSGVFYGGTYGGAIGAILINLPTHPPHAVTCLDGYPLTKKGKGGVALGITAIAAFFAASVGIVLMMLASPLMVHVALSLGPATLFAIMLLGLVAGGTMSSGSAAKGVAMTVVGILFGIVGTDVSTGTERFTFGILRLSTGVELVALALGLFGVAEFLRNVNRLHVVGSGVKMRMRDMRPSRAELKQSVAPLLRGTLVGCLFGAMPGTGPTITTFIAYAFEKKMSRKPERFGTGLLEGVAAPEASAHSKAQMDFIPTMSLGIPGDPVMALILAALMIQGIEPGPELIIQHADLFWGLIASFWIGNLLLLILNVPLIGLWVKILQIPYRYLFPAALLFIVIGVYSGNNSLFDVKELLIIGLLGVLFLALNFPVAPILLGYVLGPLMEVNFQRALVLSHGHLAVFVEHPVSAAFVGLSGVLLAVQAAFGIRRVGAAVIGRTRLSLS